MTLITALEIYNHYPENIMIEAYSDSQTQKWTAYMYMIRNREIHKTMLSFNGFPFKTKEEATLKMKNVAISAINYIKNLER